MTSDGPLGVELMPAMAAHFSPIQSPDLLPAEDIEHRSDLIKSASFTSLGVLTKNASTISIQRTFSDDTLNLQSQPLTKVSASEQNANAELFRRASKKTKKRMSMTAFAGFGDEKNTKSSRQNSTEVDESKTHGRTMGGAIKNLARRSWIGSSRSSSPVRNGGEINVEKRKSRSPVKKQASFLDKAIAFPEPVVTRKPSRSTPPPEEDERKRLPSKHVRQTQSPAPMKSSLSLMNISSQNSSATSFHALSRQSSRNSIKSQSSNEGMYLEIPRGKIPPMPKSTSTDQLSCNSIESSRKKDPLWNAFRSIEGDFASFQAKSGLQKAKTIRSVLLPFLSKHADQASITALRAEDIDHRIHILNKWWSGLLDLLNSRNQSISGTDRPAFLEAITEIMLRPEWRIPPFSKPSPEITKPKSGRPTPRWTDSVHSDDSDFLLDSIHQNIRNIFVQNLLSQMAYVVEKLSMRAAPASLINFGGKTCAYAFFFCPGVADVLVRLWRLPVGTVRRVLSEYGILNLKRDITKVEELASKFPPPARSMMLPSVSALSEHVRPRMSPRPPGSELVRWYGPWVHRWVGRDSDLFFVFAKYYHLLLCEFYPTMATKEERFCMPGLIPVHAQMLVALESSLYRQVGHFNVESYVAAEGLDALAPIPMTIPNATRAAAENRLVMLLRDMINDTNPAHQGIWQIFIGHFDLLMKAATRKVSMFNSDACFVLCDLLEELCPILGRYQQSHPYMNVFDWDFWIKVLQQMMQTQTTMSHVRVIALMYSIWNTMTATEERKRRVVLGWLLEPTFFARFFNHWSAMVRHYFYRLLCWRLARCDAEATELDLDILRILFDRLNQYWGHYQYLVAEAEMRKLSPPFASPCLPAPGRMLVIVRTDSQPLAANFAAFDKMVSHNQSTPYGSHSTPLNTLPEADVQPNKDKKRWSLLRTMNLFGSTPENNRPGEVTPPASPEDSIRRRKGIDSLPSSQPASRPTTPPHQALSFKFSLEYMHNSRPAMPGKPKKLPRPLLPRNAQKLLDDLSMMERVSSESDGTSIEVKPVDHIKPGPEDVMTARYSGRALAEWASVVQECRNFLTRRRQEGCPTDALVETPTMAVESFRMFS